MLYNTQNLHGGDVYGAAVTLDFSSMSIRSAHRQASSRRSAPRPHRCGSIRIPTAAR